VDTGRVARETGYRAGKASIRFVARMFPAAELAVSDRVPNRQQKSRHHAEGNRRTGTGIRIIAALGGN
jgi:hypothetical protein